MIPIIDCHAHLADDRIFQDADNIMEESRAHGISLVLANAARRHEWGRILQLSGKTGILAAMGIHPFFPEEWNDEAAKELRLLLQEPNNRIAAIGEIGLDCQNGRQTLPLQERAFCEQLAIAREFNLPVCIHNRKSWQEFWGILKNLGISRLRGYCHNFTSSRDIAGKILDLGLHISFCSPVTFPEARKTRDAAKYVPADRLLTETDCPDLPNTQFRGQFSSPWHACFVLEALAEIRKSPLPELAEQIASNMRCLFQTETIP